MGSPSRGQKSATEKAGPESHEEESGARGAGPEPDGDGSGPETGADRARPEADAGTQAEETTGRRRFTRDRLRGIALVVLTVALVLAGCGFLYRAHELRSAPAARNRALTDTEATTRVAGDVADDLARIFSYTPEGLDATERSARSVLTGRAARQYTQLLARIRADVAKQRVTLSTQAVRTGVVRLDGDDARLLVFLDQVSRRGKAAGSSAAAQLTVTAHRENGQWRIVDITTR
ncbi:hypothetical protein [Streptomyces sp. NPDC018610]|uniref:hypothetical protein n=1 Tax=Streptomyces sp. NPDC018610 TaxID=3365049 RepID=UPI00379B3CFC